jgi:hypothetical protein
MSRRTETGIMMMTTGKVFVGTWPVASLHRRSVAEDTTETTVTYTMLSTTQMHATELKVGTEIGSVNSKNSVMKGTMITTVLITTNLTRSGCQKWDTSQEASRHTAET